MFWTFVYIFAIVFYAIGYRILCNATLSNYEKYKPVRISKNLRIITVAARLKAQAPACYPAPGGRRF